MYMEINLKKITTHLITIFLILNSNGLYADIEDEKKEIPDSKIKNVESKIIRKASISNNSDKDLTDYIINSNPLDSYSFYFETIVNRKKERIRETNLIFDQNGDAIKSQQDAFELGYNEFIIIKGKDSKEVLFNGTFIISFKEMQNLNDFANSHNLEFILNLPEIKRGVFKISNLFNLEAKIYQILQDDNVEEVEFDTTDPNLKPE